jgi:hypothetical protein
MSRLPRFPQPPRDRYSYDNEAAFRREVATWLAGVQGLAGEAGSVATAAWEDITGTPTTLAGYGITDAQAKIERDTVQVTTASLAVDATENGTIALGKSGFILNAVADRAAWVRLYGTAAERTADAARDIADDPTNDAPVLAEFLFDASHLTIPTAPLIGYTNRDGSPVTTIYYAITNKSAGTSTVTVTFTRMNLEN